MIVRDFNKIEIKGDKLLKTFIGSDDLAYTMADEISYYQKIQDSIFPKIYEFYENGYLMEYFKDYQPLQYIPKKHHKVIFEKIFKKYNEWGQYRKTSDVFYNFLYNKIPYDKKIHSILASNKETLCDLQIIHGDLSTMNILVNSELDIKFVDPRGSDIYGPIYYDLAKLYDSYILDFGDIISGFKHEFDLKLYEDYICKYNKKIILCILYINLISKLKMHNESEQKEFIKLAEKVYSWL